MKKILSVILALVMVLSLTAALTACGGKTESDNKATEADTAAAAPADGETTAAPADGETAAAPADGETTAASAETTNSLPQAGDTVTLTGVSFTIPEGWTVKSYRESLEEIKLDPNGSGHTVTVNIDGLYNGATAVDEAASRNQVFGGDKETDELELAGKTFYRVIVSDTQFYTFADIDEKHCLHVDTMGVTLDECKALTDSFVFS